MKPKRIILIRHGESEGNVNKSVYALKPDYALLLSKEGMQQAEEAGIELKTILKDESVRFYISPLFRTRMTFQGIIRSFNKSQYTCVEEPRLREQEWGHLRDLATCEQVDRERDAYGTFYYRIPDGESAADVYDRVSDFFGTLHRDFEKADFPENTVIVTHGMTIRLFLMRWFHWTVEEFEVLRNPRNCQMFIMERNSFVKYDLKNKLDTHTVIHKFKFPGQLPVNRFKNEIDEFK